MPKSAAGTVGKVTMAAQTGIKTGVRSEADNGGASPYSAIPARRDAPEETIIQPVMAADEAAAGARDYPSARFINGEFRAQTFSDEALLYALVE